MSAQISTLDIVEWAKKEIRMKEDWIATHGEKFPPEKVEAKRYDRRALLAIVKDFGRETLDETAKLPRISELIDWSLDTRDDKEDWLRSRPRNWPEDDVAAKRYSKLILEIVASRYREAMNRRKSQT